MTLFRTQCFFSQFGRPNLPLYGTIVRVSAQPSSQDPSTMSNIPFDEKLKQIGHRTKVETILDKEQARESQNFGLIPSGAMRRRAETDIRNIQSDPFPVDLIDAYAWASDKGLDHKYVRGLIKTKEGSLPLVGGTLQYSSEGLNSLWRSDVQNRREKGIKKSAAARFKAESMKLALQELELLKSAPSYTELEAQLIEAEAEIQSLGTGLELANDELYNLEQELLKLAKANARLIEAAASSEDALTTSEPKSSLEVTAREVPPTKAVTKAKGSEGKLTPPSTN
jgi:hypothetical protein